MATSCDAATALGSKAARAGQYALPRADRLDCEQAGDRKKDDQDLDQKNSLPHLCTSFTKFDLPDSVH